MQTLTFENYQGQIIFHWYVLSLKSVFFFVFASNQFNMYI